MVYSLIFQVGLWIDAGSRFETEQNNGVAHFLEHMIFKVSFEDCCNISSIPYKKKLYNNYSVINWTINVLFNVWFSMLKVDTFNLLNYLTVV